MTEQEWRMMFARRLERRMIEKRMTPTSLSKAASISPMTLSRYLRGLQTARIDVILKLADALECNVEDLVGVHELVDI